MKGQAFVTFPTEESAVRALEDTNGYVHNTKPMVVVSLIYKNIGLLWIPLSTGDILICQV